LLLSAVIAAQTVVTALITMQYATNRLHEGKAQVFQHAIDDSIPFLTATDDLSILLTNPDRGFRMESYLTLGTNLAYPSRQLTPDDEITTPTSQGAVESLQSQLTLYEDDQPTIIQQYIYLTLYATTPELPDIVFIQLTQYFEDIRALGIKMLLRFAYMTENNAVDPSQAVMLGHIAQLKNWFENNEELVADTVYCLQLGFIGFWGEGHSHKVAYDVPAVIGAVCEMTPAWMYINLRTLWYYYQTPAQYRARVGIHDDYLVGFHHGPDTVMPADKFKQPHYRDLFQRTINDGELPWGGVAWGEYDGGRIDGRAVTSYCYDYSLSTFSIVHNYIESGIDNPYSMHHWKSEYLDARSLGKYGWNYNPNLLDEAGHISVFEYLKYHLGYHLVLSNLTVSDNHLTFMISNYGFAAPFNMNTLMLRAVQADTSIELMPLTFDPHGLCAYGQLVYSAELDLATVASVEVKLANSRNTDYVRFANSIASVDGFYTLL
jgi:hypothetical protein